MDFNLLPSDQREMVRHAFAWGCASPKEKAELFQRIRIALTAAPRPFQQLICPLLLLGSASGYLQNQPKACDSSYLPDLSSTWLPKSAPGIGFYGGMGGT